MIILVKAIIFYIDHFARDDLIETIDIKDYGVNIEIITNR